MWWERLLIYATLIKCRIQWSDDSEPASPKLHNLYICSISSYNLMKSGWMTMKPPVDTMALHVHVLWRNRRQRPSHSLQQNRCFSLALLTVQYNACQNRIISEHTVHLILLGMILCHKCLTCVSVEQTSLQTTPTLSPASSCLDLESIRKSYLLEWITIHPSTRRWPCENTLYSRGTVAFP